jgi:hypothetical protein
MLLPPQLPPDPQTTRHGVSLLGMIRQFRWQISVTYGVMHTLSDGAPPIHKGEMLFFLAPSGNACNCATR